MDRKEDDLLKNQTLERKALPKRIRQEMKAREMMFRESMRISVNNLHEAMKPMEEKDRLKKVGLPKSFAPLAKYEIKLIYVFSLSLPVSRSREEALSRRAAAIRDKAPSPAGGSSRVRGVRGQGARAAAEREAKNAHGARDAQAQGARRGLRRRAQGVEGAT